MSDKKQTLMERFGEISKRDDWHLHIVGSDIRVMLARIEELGQWKEDATIVMNRWDWARGVAAKHGRPGDNISDIVRDRIEQLEAIVEKLGSTVSASLTTHCPVTGEHLHDVSEAHKSLANIVMQECEAALTTKETKQ